MTRRKSRVAKAQEAGMKLIKSVRETVDIYAGEGSKLFTMLRKAANLKAESNQGNTIGELSPLIDKHAARELRDFNSTHAICIDAKVSSSVGMGHRDQDIYDVLDPLCRHGWQDVLDSLGEDFAETGEAFLEVAFNNPANPREVTGLFHVESANVRVNLEEEDSEHWHYIVHGQAGEQEVVMARWDDLAELKARFMIDDTGSAGDRGSLEANQAQATVRVGIDGEVKNSELIHIRQPTNRSRHYGYPDYMSAVPSIELVQCMTQHEFDFYFNRGVPEFILFLLGRNVGKSWEKIESLIKANQGPGNTHKTGGVHIPGNPEETKVQLEKLAMEDAANSGFTEKSGTLDMRIATAHGMPPQLANIALPGKIGGANEGPNAMLTFQKRKLGRIQRNFSRVFACSLAQDGITFATPSGGSESLEAGQFLGEGAERFEEDGTPNYVEKGNGFCTILDGMTLGAMETLSTMREPMAGSGRNPEDGTLGGTDERSASDPRRTR